MLTAASHVIHRRRITVLVVAGVVFLLAALAGFGLNGGFFGKATAGGFDAAGSPAQRATAAATDEFGRTDYDVVVTYTQDGSTVEDPTFADTVSATLAAAQAAHPGDIVELVDPLTAGAPDPRRTGLVSEDGTTVVALVRLAGTTEGERDDSYSRVADSLVAPDPVQTLRGGNSGVGTDVNTQVSADLGLAEGVMVPIVLVLLVVFLGGLVAGALPLAIGGFAIIGSFGVLSLLGEVTDVSIFSINVVTALGLGLAVDYGLFVVARFREELTPGRDVADALAATMATAGRTVLVSGLTVALSLAAMLFFPFMFVRSLGVGSISAVVLAMVAALTVLPALLALLGHRVDALSLPFRRGVRAGATSGSGAWAVLARIVMRRPVTVIVACLALLAVFISPVTGLKLGGVDERVLPERAEGRQATELVDSALPALATDSVELLARTTDGSPLSDAAVADVTAGLGELAGSEPRVGARTGTAVLLSVPLPDADPYSDASRQLVRDSRALDVPGGEVLVTGETARFIDRLSVIEQRLPWAAGFVIVAELLLLFWAFGSIVLPVKAAVLNVVTIAATFGVLVWAFGDGNLAGLIGFTETGFLETSQLIIIVAIAFGLSMDYAVFLLSRMREEWDATGDNTRAVAHGLQRTGGIVTAAALLLGLVVGGFMLGDVTFIQMIGLGLAFALLLDATVVRGFLVPAAMRLLGRANWWAPAPLARWWQRYGLREGPTRDRPAPATDPDLAMVR